MQARVAKHDYNIYYILIYLVRVRVFLLFLDGIGNDVYSYKINELHTHTHVTYTHEHLYIPNSLESIIYIEQKILHTII